MVGPSVTSTGFLAQTSEQIRGELRSAFRVYFGQDVDVESDSSPFTHIIRIVADRETLLQQALQLFMSLQALDNAFGVMLDALAEGLGVRKRNARTRATTSTQAFSANAASVFLPLNHVITQSGDTTILGRVTTAITIPLASVWGTGNTYEVGKPVSINDSGTNRIYVCSQAGTSGVSGPSGTGTAEITDGTAKWLYVGDGLYGVTVAAEAETAGALTAALGVFDTNVGSIAGLTGTRNALAWTSGVDQESDASYRTGIRLALAGKAGTLGSIASATDDNDFVTAFLARTNRSAVTDAAGDDPHSWHIILSDPLTLTTEQQTDLLTDLGTVSPAGIKSIGTSFRGDILLTLDDGTVLTVEDEVGADFASTVRVYVRVELTKNTAIYPADGDSQITTYLSTTRKWAAGQTARPHTMECEIEDLLPAGSLNDISVSFSTSGTPAIGSRLTVTVTDTQVITIDSADITIS